MPAKSAVERGRQRGQTLVEFALVLPVFVVLTLGVLDAARVFSAQVAISNSVREAAVFATRGANYLAWCSNPGDPADLLFPSAVACPPGTLPTNWAADPNNIAYRITAETSGLDRGRITLAAPTCGTGSGQPSATCTSASAPKYVMVSVTYQMDLVTPVIAQLWGKPVTITAFAIGRSQ